ncbi:MAG: hypothetical protein IJ062_08045 [Firmicutes bacterium]|nr:hypothetical protein [Bacillota bacterium]
MKKRLITVFTLCVFAGGCSSSISDFSPAVSPMESDIYTETFQTEQTEPQTGTAAGSADTYKTDFSQTLTISDPDIFFGYLTEACDNLVTELHFKIDNFDEDTYDIHKFKRGKYSLSSNGKIIGKTAYMDYTFNYSDNYIITHACADNSLIPLLNEEQQHIVTSLGFIRDSVISDDMTDYEKELALHDYIVKNYSYDVEAAKAAEISDTATGIIPFLLNKKGVCEAYANTFMALCSLSGIECHIVTGKLDGVNHAWNVVKIDGEYYNVDVTSDDPVPDEPQHVYRSYFNITDVQLNRSHIPDDNTYICSSEKYNYFTYNNLVVNDFDSLKSVINDHISHGESVIAFRCDNYTFTSNDLLDILNFKGFNSYYLSGDMSDPYSCFELTLKK